MFNIPQIEQQDHIDCIKRNAVRTPLGNQNNMITDTYKLMVNPALQGLPSVIKAEHLNIKKLDVLINM